MDRSTIRHTCFRMKNGQAFRSEYQMVVDIIQGLKGDHKWEDFADKWDVFVDKGDINIILPETDEAFIKETCITMKTLAAHGLDVEQATANFTTRQKNIVEVIILNYAGEEVNWSTFGEEWGITVDYDNKRFSPYSFKTEVNEVTIEEPAQEEKPVVTAAHVSDFEDMTAEEIDVFEKFLKKKKARLG